MLPAAAGLRLISRFRVGEARGAAPPSVAAGLVSRPRLVSRAAAVLRRFSPSVAVEVVLGLGSGAAGARGLVPFRKDELSAWVTGQGAPALELTGFVVADPVVSEHVQEVRRRRVVGEVEEDCGRGVAVFCCTVPGMGLVKVVLEGVPFVKEAVSDPVAVDVPKEVGFKDPEVADVLQYYLCRRGVPFLADRGRGR